MEIEHGTYKIKSYPNNIVVADAKGPWNFNTVKNYHDDMEKLVQEFNGNPWHFIAILRGETLFIPEVVECLERHIIWRSKNNVASDTIILCESFNTSISKEQIYKTHNKLGLKVEFANSLTEALENASDQ